MPMYKAATPPPLTVSEEQLKEFLMRFDTDNDGRLSWKEVVAAFKYAGQHFCHLKAAFSVYHSDQDANGFIDEDEMNEFVSSYS
ncbi:hypothetical protein Ancab_016321 [Ancistrocladus abbreviatus]